MHARVDALDGLEDGDAGGEGGVGLRGGGALEAAGGPERHHAVDDAADGEERGEDFSGEREGIHG